MTSKALFGCSQETLDEINKVLDDPTCSVDSLLCCRGLVAQVRCENPRLQEFFKREDSMKRIFCLIHTSSDRAQQASLLSLFQTSNTCLHRALAESITLADYAMSILDKDTENAKFSAGVVTRIFAKAFDLWPEDMSEVFRLSKTLSITCIEHIDLLSVFYCAQQVVSVLASDVWVFLWRCLSVVAWPRQFSLNCKYVPMLGEIDRSKITPRHIQNLMELLRLFFKARKDDDDQEFAENVRAWLRQVDLTADRLKLALVLARDSVLAQKVIDFIHECTDYEDELFWRAVEYLVYDSDDCPTDELVHLLKLCLTHENVSNFARIEIKNLFMAKDWGSTLQIQALIAKAYTEHADNPQLLPFILACSAHVTGPEFIPGWPDFCEKVVDKYLSDEPWEDAFKFPINV